MDFVEVGVLVAIWGIFGFNVYQNYKKAKSGNRGNFLNIKDFGFWEDSMRILGILLFFSGFIADIAVMKHFGAYLLVAGWLLGGIVLLEKDKKRGFIIMMVAILFGWVYYIIWF